MKVGLVSCSNGQQKSRKAEIDRLMETLAGMGICAEQGSHLYAENGVFGGTARERAGDLMAFYMDESIDAIYDISGGDIANEILEFLDYEIIGRSGKVFWGYSDLTTVINAVFTQTGNKSVLYQVKNLVWDNAALQQERFQTFVTGRDSDLYNIRYEFLQGKHMEGIVIGGNVRCLLKLAGTPYWPDMKGKILVLEALSGNIPRITTYFNQLRQMGVFEQVSGILLGTFTELAQAAGEEKAYELLSALVSPDLPVVRTPDIGHGFNAKAIIIGGYLYFTKNKGALRSVSEN